MLFLLIHWDTLKLDPGSFIDSQYRSSESDLLFTTLMVGTPAGILTLRVMKAERLGMLLDDPVWDEDLVGKASMDLFEQILRYIASAADLDKPAFFGRIKMVKDERIRQTAMTLEQQFRQEGRQEGRLEGRLKGERLLLERQLIRRFGPLPEWVCRFLEEATTDQLEQWGEAILDAPSLESVFRQ